MPKEKSLAEQFKELIQPPEQPETKIKLELEKLLPDAINVMRDVLQSESTSIDQKFKASKTIIDLSDLNKNQTPAQPPLNRFLSQLSTQEIANLKKTADKILTNWEKTTPKSK